MPTAPAPSLTVRCAIAAPASRTSTAVASPSRSPSARPAPPPRLVDPEPRAESHAADTPRPVVAAPVIPRGSGVLGSAGDRRHECSLAETGGRHKTLLPTGGPHAHSRNHSSLLHARLFAPSLLLSSPPLLPLPNPSLLILLASPRSNISLSLPSPFASPPPTTIPSISLRLLASPPRRHGCFAVFPGSFCTMPGV